jgi:undecaprenyl-diphosphatase
MTISGGLFLGLSRDAAARFGFLLSIPILIASGLKKLADLAGTGALSSIGPELLLGCAVAFVSGLAAIHALLLFLRTKPLYPFVIYRLALAAVILFAL